MSFFRNSNCSFEHHLSRWESGGDYSRVALAWNLRYDHRVFQGREAEFLKYFAGAPAGTDPLSVALVEYRKQTVCLRAGSSFLRGENESNFVFGSPRGGSEIHPNLQLGTIFDLTGCLAAMNNARLDGHPAFRAVRIEDALKPEDAGWNGFLYEHFIRQDNLAKQRSLLDDIFYAVDKYAHHRPPTWVTYWDRLASYLTKGSIRALNALGMARRSSPRILVALRYAVRDVGNLVRPTQLDAGDFPFHYPSHPARTCPEGGTTMDCDRGAHYHSAVDLIPEFIHAPTLFNSSYWINGGSWIQQSMYPAPVGLSASRAAHQRALHSIYGLHSPHWMPEH
ncbi:MAG TPA: hypothetical protein VEQ63_10195 [Bryobacteraceae bacterium]|nr:hypothetical protein [Bryobacteraceae bacterium]